jgi:hypothetical protein
MRPGAEIMADAILEGMQGKLVLRSDGRGVTYANPLHAVKLYQDYMLKAKELAIRAQEAKKNQTGPGGGIRIVLPSVPVDPLLRPGQPPRPLRLLGFKIPRSHSPIWLGLRRRRRRHPARCRPSLMRQTLTTLSIPPS